MLFRMNREYFCECCEFYKTFEEMHGDNDTICAVCQEGQEEWEYINRGYMATESVFFGLFRRRVLTGERHALTVCISRCTDLLFV